MALAPDQFPVPPMSSLSGIGHRALDHAESNRRGIGLLVGGTAGRVGTPRRLSGPAIGRHPGARVLRPRIGSAPSRIVRAAGGPRAAST